MSARDAHMQDQRAAALDDLLSRWHHWQISSRATTAQGFGSQAAVVGEFTISRQYDTGEMLDDAINSRECGAVEYAVQQITEADRRDGTSFGLALRILARSLYLGTSAIISPRLPTGAQLQAILDEARLRLLNRLISAGVID